MLSLSLSLSAFNCCPAETALSALPRWTFTGGFCAPSFIPGEFGFCPEWALGFQRGGDMVFLDAQEAIKQQEA